MRITISYRPFIEHSQYYTGCSWPTVCGIGSTPHEALDDAISGAVQIIGDDNSVIVALLTNLRNLEPDEPGKLADIPGWDDDGSKVSWHCELTIEGLEETS